MGLITGIRERLHFLFYALVAAFLALIIFEWGMDFSGSSGGRTVAGKVNGNPVDYRQYERTYDSLVDDFRNQAPQAALTDAIERELRQRAWDIVVNSFILEEQFERYNIRVSSEEILAAVESDMPPQVIFQNFFDKETGAVDRERLEKARMAPENREIWITIEDIIRKELMEKKLQRTLSRMVRVTDAEVNAVAEREYGVFSASFFVAPYSIAGDDALFTVSDEEVETYYNENRDLFRQEPARSLDYVVFSAVPSTRDSLSIRTELASLAEDFAEAEDDSAFVNLQSDLSDTFEKLYSRTDFSSEAGDRVFGKHDLKAGDVIGPVADRNRYRLIKVKAVAEGKPVAKASHILIPFKKDDEKGKAAAKKAASRVLKKIRSGKNFTDLAKKYSKDQSSASKGGDLGWFARESMVPEFGKAVFEADVGSVIGPVETVYGYHIIRVTGKDSRAIRCSEVVRNMRPSDATLQSARRKAAEFQMEAEEKSFAEASEAFGKERHETGWFTQKDEIQRLGYNHAVAKFAFASPKGSVSNVVQTDAGYLVMRVAGVNDSGYRKLDNKLRSDIRSGLMTRKKGKALDQRLISMLEKYGGDLEAIAGSLGGLSVIHADSIRFRDQTIPDYGSDIRLIEAIIGMDPGTVSRPVPVANGRALIALHKKTYQNNVPEPGKAMLGGLLLQAKQKKFEQDYFTAERNAADIEDQREY